MRIRSLKVVTTCEFRKTTNIKQFALFPKPNRRQSLLPRPHIAVDFFVRSLHMETRPQTKENRLAGEKSPYLLQHKENPVEWYED
jgi:hypothetical protein